MTRGVFIVERMYIFWCFADKYSLSFGTFFFKTTDNRMPLRKFWHALWALVHAECAPHLCPRDLGFSTKLNHCGEPPSVDGDMALE
jgi:hypothetical protein